MAHTIENNSRGVHFPTSIAPWLSVRNSAKAVECYKVILGAVVAYRLDTPDGTAVAKLEVDGAAF